jgi:hypothetical protein
MLNESYLYDRFVKLKASAKMANKITDHKFGTKS